MGQYFTFVNVDKQEQVRQPEGTKLPEIVASGLSGQVLSYLLFDGPFDGTTLLQGLYDQDNETAQQLVKELIDRETERETESNRDRQSVYRNDDGSWNRNKLHHTALASGYTGDHAICGRWASDDVRIIGDYADDGYYHAIEGTIIAERDTGEIVEWHGTHPSPVGGDHSETASRGDQIAWYGGDTASSETVRFMYHRDSDWTDITDSVFAEMARYNPGQFGDLDDGTLEPDIVFGKATQQSGNTDTQPLSHEQSSESDTASD